MAPGSIPPYLTSGAFSRAHHAFVVKLDQAVSPQAVDVVIGDEVQRLRAEIVSHGLSTAKTSQRLLILLHCALLSRDTSLDLSFALVQALKLAEGGKTLRERRIGYLYLAERLPVGHELGLLFINTIRKDLSSSSPAHILLATSAITSVPSQELSPAVLPLLSSRALLRHKLPAIRKATLHSLRALCTGSNASADARASSSSSTLTAPSTFVLPSERLGRLLSSETEPDVLSAILKCVNLALKRDATYCTPRSLWISAVLQAAGKLAGKAVSQVTLDIVALLERLISDLPESEDTRSVATYIEDRLRQISSLRGWQGALVIRSCAFISSLHEAYHSGLINGVLRIIRHVLKANKGELQANDHCVLLRCLLLLPRSVVETRLNEQEMAVVMSGLDHHDQTIRRQTLRLLSSLDPTLSSLSINMQLDRLRAISESSDLKQRQLVAHRALEIAIVDAEHCHDGGPFARRVHDICIALESPKRAGKARSNGILDPYALWEDGLTAVLEVLRDVGAAFRASFTSSLVEVCRDLSDNGQTVAVILASVLCEHKPNSRSEEILKTILEQLRHSPGYVQEPLLIALVAVLARDGPIDPACVASCVHCVRSLQQVSKKPLRSRCEQIIKVIEDDLLGQVSQERLSDTLIDWLQGMATVVAKQRKASRSLASPSVQSPDAVSPEPQLSASVLRYDAYEAPPTPSRVTTAYSTEDEDDVEEKFTKPMTAGDLALLSSASDRRQGKRRDKLANGSLESKLGLLGLQESGSSPPPRPVIAGRRGDQRLPDPFGDSDLE